MSNGLQKLSDYDELELPTTIQIISKMAVKRATSNKDLCIGLSGKEGEGKTTLAIELSVAICREANLEFSLDENMIYSNEIQELKNKLTELPKVSPIVPDEAIKFLYKLNWASAGQRYINTLYSLARKENKITILPIPRFTDINEFFRNHRIRIWIHIVKEGHAVMFNQDWSPFSYKDPWMIQENEKIIEKIRKQKKFSLFTLQDKMRALRQCRNFVIAFKFPKLPDRIYGQYEILARQRYDDLEEMFGIDEKGRKIPYKEGLARMIEEMRKKDYDLERISYISGLPIPTINKLLLRIEGEKGKVPI